MKAVKEGSTEAFRNEKPGAWEKFRVEKHGNVYALKSFHDKYVRCMDNGELKADSTVNFGWEKFIIYQLKTN